MVYTKTYLILENLPTLDRLDAATQVLKAIVAPRGNESAGISHNAFSNIEKMFEGCRPCESLRLLEAAEGENRKPSKLWIKWFGAIVEQSNLEASEISTIGERYDELLHDTLHFVAKIPWRIRQMVSPGFGRSEQPWYVQFRLRRDLDLAEIPSLQRAELESGGGPGKCIRQQLRWWEIKARVQESWWDIEWPEIGALHQRVWDVLESHRRNGITDVSLRPEDVLGMVEQLFVRHQPDWMRSPEPLPAGIQAKLSAGILQPPWQLRVDYFYKAIAEELGPEEVRGDWVAHAVATLIEAGKIQAQPITFLPGGHAIPTALWFYCWNTLESSKERKHANDPCQISDEAIIDFDGKDSAEFCGTQLKLTAEQCAILESLYKNFGKLVQYGTLLKVIRGEMPIRKVNQAPPDLRYHMAKIRKALEAVQTPYTIDNTSGQGYRILLANK